MVQRNRWAFITFGVVATALIVGLGATTWMFLREKAARKEAASAVAKERVAKRNTDELVRRIIFNGIGSHTNDKSNNSLHGLNLELTRDDEIQAILEHELDRDRKSVV